MVLEQPQKPREKEALYSKVFSQMGILIFGDFGEHIPYSSVGSGVCPFWKPHNKVYIITYFSAAELLIPGS